MEIDTKQLQTQNFYLCKQFILNSGKANAVKKNFCFKPKLSNLMTFLKNIIKLLKKPQKVDQLFHILRRLSKTKLFLWALSIKLSKILISQ